MRDAVGFVPAALRRRVVAALFPDGEPGAPEATTDADPDPEPAPAPAPEATGTDTDPHGAGASGA